MYVQVRSLTVATVHEEPIPIRPWVLRPYVGKGSVLRVRRVVRNERRAVDNVGDDHGMIDVAVGIWSPVSLHNVTLDELAEVFREESKPDIHLLRVETKARVRVNGVISAFDGGVVCSYVVARVGEVEGEELGG